MKKRIKARQPDSRVNESMDTDLNEPQPLELCPTPELTLTLTLAQSLEDFLALPGVKPLVYRPLRFRVPLGENGSLTTWGTEHVKK